MVPSLRAGRCAALLLLCVVCARAWERGVDRRSLPGVRVLDLRFAPPVAGTPPEDFVEALRSMGSFMANRGYTVPASSDVPSHGTVAFDTGVHSARAEAQADACLVACNTYNTLAAAAGGTGSPFRCAAITTQVTQSRVRFYVDVGYSSTSMWRGEASCSTPIPQKASCFLLSGSVDAEFTPVLLTLTRFELTHSSCLLSAILEGASACPDTARRAPWRPLFSPAGAVLETSAAAGQGPACACPPHVAGARCSLLLDTECAVPAAAPRLEAHCAAASSAVLDGGVVYTARACDKTLFESTCQVCANPDRHGPLCTLDKCTLDDGSPRCDPDAAVACHRGFCLCPPGLDPVTGCRTCAAGFVRDPDNAAACVAMEGCWASWDADSAAPDWFERGGHGGRAQMCNGHGSCVPSGGGDPPLCVCDDLWNGAGCTVDMHKCGLQGAVQQRRDSVVGACSLTALDPSRVARPCSNAEGIAESIAFTVTDVLAPRHGWKVCSLLGAVVDAYDAGDEAQASHCAAVAPQAVDVAANGTVMVETIPGPGCDWRASVQNVFGDGMALGIPVRCRGPACAPRGTTTMATWAELVPWAGVPTVYDARAACRQAVAGPLERASVASSRDVDEMQMRQLRGARGTRGSQTAILWYLDDLFADLGWRAHSFVWVGDANYTTGAWQQRYAPSLVGSPAARYLQPDADDPWAEPHHHSVACVVHAAYTPGVQRLPSRPVAQGGATTLLWLDIKDA